MKKRRKQHEAKKHQKVIQVKEVKMAPKIGEHDFQTKMRQAIDFLKEGKRVKITLFFKGVKMPPKWNVVLSCLKKFSKSFEQLIY